MDTTAPDQVREQVRVAYAAAARAATDDPAQATQQSSDCCGPDCCGPDADPEPDSFGPGVYPPDDRAGLPRAAVDSGLGCGNPLAVADLHEGETVLDLGSGGGGDVLRSARRVGPTGRVYGLDMTDEMLALARRNAAEAGTSNAEFLRGHIEDIPLPDRSVDVIISNCVVNLSPDKPAVFHQMHRVLRPGGRVGLTDVVAEDHLSPAGRGERGDWAGCVAGALSRSEYQAGLAAAGFTDIRMEFTHPVADGIHSAIVQATRPA